MKASLWLLSLVVLCGCATPEQLTTPVETVKVTTLAFEETVEESEELRLFNGDSGLALGSTRAGTRQAFPQPSGASTFNDLPQNFGADFTAYGWESDEMTFGTIAYRKKSGPEDTSRGSEKVVFAMYTRPVPEDEPNTVSETVDRYLEAYGEPTTVLPGASSQYWFWTRKARRLMICRSVDHSGREFVTVALGAPQMMRELRMTSDLARADQALAIERLSNGKE